HLVNLGAAQTGQGLVQEQHLGLAGERARKLEQAQLLLRQAAREELRVGVEAGLDQRFLRNAARVVLGRGVNVRADDDILDRRPLSPPRAFEPLRVSNTTEASRCFRRTGRSATAAERGSAAGGCARGWAATRLASRRSIRSLIFQTTPSGARRITATIATPNTTPWMPGTTSPSSACRSSPNGTRTTAPITGPHSVPTPPNIATINACADTSLPNTAGGV